MRYPPFKQLGQNSAQRIWNPANKIISTTVKEPEILSLDFGNPLSRITLAHGTIDGISFSDAEVHELLW